MLLLTVAGRVAFAQQPATPGPPLLEPGAVPPPQAPAEAGVVTASQIVLGTVSGVGAGIGAVALAAGGTVPITVGLVGTAVLSGFTVCVIGSSSRRYEGSCGPPILGSYLGALVVGLPLGLLAAQVKNPDRDGGSEISLSALLTAAVVASVATGVGATIGWHLGRRVRPRPAKTGLVGPPPALPAPRESWPEMPVRALTPSQGVISLPVLAFRF